MHIVATRTCLDWFDTLLHSMCSSFEGWQIQTSACLPMISSAWAATPVEGSSVLSRLRPLVLMKRHIVNPSERRIVCLSWEHYIVATKFAHWFYSTGHALDLDGYFPCLSCELGVQRMEAKPLAGPLPSSPAVRENAGYLIHDFVRAFTPAYWGCGIVNSHMLGGRIG